MPPTSLRHRSGLRLAHRNRLRRQQERSAVAGALVFLGCALVLGVLALLLAP